MGRKRVVAVFHPVFQLLKRMRPHNPSPRFGRMGGSRYWLRCLAEDLPPASATRLLPARARPALPRGREILGCAEEDRCLYQPITMFDSITFRECSRSEPVCCM